MTRWIRQGPDCCGHARFLSVDCGGYLLCWCSDCGHRWESWTIALRVGR